MRGTLSRHLHTTSRLYSTGSLFNLSGLSHSRESGFLSKERGIPRTEFAPHLELIRLSEVEPFAEKKKLHAVDSLQPSRASSQKPVIQQGGDGGISVAYLIQELESTRVAKEEAERSNTELRHRTRVLEAQLEETWDRLAALSIFAAVASILGLYYRREVSDFILRFSPSTRGSREVSNPSPAPADAEKIVEIPIPVVPLEDASPPTPGRNVDHFSFWRRMFWAN